MDHSRGNYPCLCCCHHLSEVKLILFLWIKILGFWVNFLNFSYLVSVLYFTYPTTMDIRLDRSTFVHLPSVTVCSELPATILIEDLARVSPPIFAIFLGKTKPEIRRLLGRKSVREKLLTVFQSMPIHIQHKFTVSGRNFFYECALPTPTSGLKAGNTAITCEQFSPIVETINNRYKCFSLFLNRTSAFTNQKLNYKLPKNLISHFKYLVWMGIRREYIFNGFLYIHPPHSTWLIFLKNLIYI